MTRKQTDPIGSFGIACPYQRSSKLISVPSAFFMMIDFSQWYGIISAV
jgi:hypothetical protein